MLMTDMQYDFYSELNRTKERVDAMIYLLRDNVTQLRAQVCMYVCNMYNTGV